MIHANGDADEAGLPMAIRVAGPLGPFRRNRDTDENEPVNDQEM